MMVVLTFVVVLAVISLILVSLRLMLGVTVIPSSFLFRYFNGKKIRVAWVVLCVCCFCLAMVCFQTSNLMATIHPDKKSMENVVINEGIKAKEPSLKQNKLIALFGVDNQGNDQNSSDNRSDCIIIAAVCHKTKEIKLLSVYRDTYVSINGKYDKVNAAYAYGGPELAVSTLNRNLDLDITDYVTVNFKSLADAVDVVGGIELSIESEKELKNLNDYIGDMNRINGGKSQKFKKTGTYNFDGNQAVAYTRIRYMEGGDHTRAEHQRRVVKELFHKLKRRPWKTFGVMKRVLPDVRTSLTKRELQELCRKGIKYKISDETMSSYPSDSYDVKYKGIYYGFPVTVKENVRTAHLFIYGTEKYKLTDELTRIADKIKAVSDNLGLK